MTPTRQEIADVIDATHDELLEHGRCVTLTDHAGRMCVVRAIGTATSRFVDVAADFRAWVRLHNATTDVITDRAGRCVVSWNYDATDDEVFDLLKRTSKELRDEATP